jgi:hypothetical protein
VVRFIRDFRAGATTWHRFSLFVRQRVNGVERKPPCGLLSRYSEAVRPSLPAEDRFELRNVAPFSAARNHAPSDLAGPARLQPVKLAGTIVFYTDGTLNLAFCSIEG